MAHEGYHEPYQELPESIRDIHRAIASLMEEIEAVDWYYQRAAASKDEALRAVILHNAHEEVVMQRLSDAVLQTVRHGLTARHYLDFEGPLGAGVTAIERIDHSQKA